MDVPQFLFFLFLIFCVKPYILCPVGFRMPTWPVPTYEYIQMTWFIPTWVDLAFIPIYLIFAAGSTRFWVAKQILVHGMFFNGPHIVWRYQIPHTCTMPAWFIPMLYLNPFPIGISFAWPGRDDKQLHGASTLGHPSRSVAGASGVYGCGEICT